MKTKLIALCGICSALSLLCQVGASYLVWAGLFFVVLSAVAVSLPTLIDFKYFYWSVLTYLASTVLGLLLGSGLNPLNVLLSALFCTPFALIKLFCQSPKKQKQSKADQKAEELFSFDKNTLVSTKREVAKISGIKKWIVYYLFLATALTAGFFLMKLFVPTLFQREDLWLLITLTVVGFCIFVPVFDRILGAVFDLAKSKLKNFIN